MFIKKFIPILFLMVFGTVGCNQLSEPRNYDDCILQNMRGIDSDLGAAQIIKSCSKKFPKSSYMGKIRELSELEIRNITGSASLSFDDYYSGDIYNGNRDITITALRIHLTSKYGENETNREYLADVKVPPLTKGNFLFSILEANQAADYSWSISGAEGYSK